MSPIRNEDIFGYKMKEEIHDRNSFWNLGHRTIINNKN